jgi:hypothetical protein
LELMSRLRGLSWLLVVFQAPSCDGNMLFLLIQSLLGILCEEIFLRLHLFKIVFLLLEPGLVK